MKRLLAIAFCLAASAAWAQVPGAPEQSSGGGGTAGTGSTNVFGTAGQISVAGSSGGPYTISLPTTITSNEIFSGSVVLNGPLSGTGLTNYLASPAAIGGTAAAAGTFSTLTDTGMTGGPFCVHETSGVLAATASDCGSGSVSITAADGSIVVSPSPLTGTGTIRVGTVPAASIASGALANGMTATTQTVGDNTTELATDAFVIANAGGGGSLTVTDGTHSVAATTTLTVGNGLLIGGSAGSATLSSIVPNRTVATGGATIGPGDIGGQVNSSDASAQTFTQPSTATAGAGLTFLETNQAAGVVTLSGGQTLNGLASASLFQNGWASCTGNSATADCFGWPGWGGVSGDIAITATGVSTVGKIGGTAIALGTLTNGFVCTYTSAGTLLACNTNLAVTAGEAVYGSGAQAPSGSTGMFFSSTAILAYTGTSAVIAGTSCTIAASGAGGCSGLTNGDCGVTLVFTSASAVTVTLPNSITTTCPVTIEQKGAGAVTLSAAGGATLHTAHSFTGKTAGQYSTIGAFVDSNSGGTSAIWVMTGDGA